MMLFGFLLPGKRKQRGEQIIAGGVGLEYILTYKQTYVHHEAIQTPNSSHLPI